MGMGRGGVLGVCVVLVWWRQGLCSNLTWGVERWKIVGWSRVAEIG